MDTALAFFFACAADSPGTRGRTAEKVVIEGCKLQGLGIRIVGGRNITLADGEMSDFGIFIKEVIDGRLAKRDGIIYVPYSTAT